MSLGPNIIQLMLHRATGGGGAPQPEASDYDWTRPHGLTRPAAKVLEDLLARAAEDLSAALSRIVRDPITVVPHAVGEVYASAAADTGSDQKRYSIPLTTGQDLPCGALATDGRHAMGWVARLLGATDGGAGGAGRELSALEQSLLGDVMASLATAMLGPFNPAAAPEIVPGRSVSRQLPPLGAGSAQYVEVNFVSPDKTDEPVLSALIAAGVLSPVLERTDGQGPQPPGEASRNMMGQIGRVGVTVVGHLGQTEISIRDASAIEAGDVLVLDLAVGQAAPLSVQGSVIAMGLPVRHGEHKAMQITEWIETSPKGPRDRGESDTT